MSLQTIRFTPSDYGKDNNISVTNISNAYTDTDSTTYAVASTGSGGELWFYGFDFSQIPSGITIESVEYKIKASVLGTAGVYLGFDDEESDLISLSTTAQVVTPTWDIPFSTIMSNSDYFAIVFGIDNSDVLIYGMEIAITYDDGSTPSPTPSDTLNKLVVNGETKFDLTEDTVIEEDVLSGINFHLPSGVAAIGTMGGTDDVKTATYTPSSNSLTATFSVTKEPIMFACIATSEFLQTNMCCINTVCSDGTSTHRVTCYRSSKSSSGAYSGYICCSDSADITWLYTNGTLAIRSLFDDEDGGYFAGGITYTLFYI